MKLVEQTDEAVLYDRAVEAVRRVIAERCVEAGGCMVGIVGGRSLMEVFTRLSIEPQPFRGRVEFFWLDERLPVGQKNADEIVPRLEAMRRAGVDVDWHPLDATDRETIAAQADAALARLRQSSGGLRFDLVLCSAGEDGHVASLFPGHATLAMGEPGYVFELRSPKPPPERITVTPPLLTSARSAMLFITGAKSEALRRFSSPDVSVSDCPAKILLAVDDLTVFTSIVLSSGGGRAD